MRDFIAEGAKYEPLTEQQRKEALERIDKSVADEKYDNRFAWRTEKDEDGNLKVYRTGDNTPKDSYGKDLFEAFMAGVGDLALTPKKAINALEEAIYDNGVGRAIPFFKGARPLGMLVNGFYDAYSMLLGSDFEKRVEHYKKESDRYQEQKGIIDYLAEGEYGKAAGTAGVEASRNIPQLVTAYLGSYFTKGMEASTAFSSFLASGAAADKYEEIKNNDQLSAADKGVAVLGTFCAEFFGEKLSNDTWFKLFRNEPVKAINLLKGDVVKAAKSFAKKAIGWGWRIACEPTGEGVTELAEQTIDYALGLSDGVNWSQVGDAAIVGGLVGGGGNIALYKAICGRDGLYDCVRRYPDRL